MQKQTYKRIFFADFPLDLFDLKESAEITANKDDFFQIISLNAEQIVLALDDNNLKKIFQEANLVIPDGEGAVLAAKFSLSKEEKSLLNQGFFEIKKLSGVDLAEKLIKEKNRVAILGSKQKVIDQLQEKYLEKIVFAENGYFEEDKEEEITEKIRNSKAELLLVGLGSPKQEYFIYKHRKSFQRMVCMGVGGALDVLANEKKRAPKFLIDLKLEWFFRLIREPLRIKRILLRIPRYLVFLLRLKILSTWVQKKR